MPNPLKLLARTPVLGLVRGPGKHRVPRFPSAPYAAVVPQAIRYCPPCGASTAATLHPRGSHTCGDCGHTHHPEEV